MARVVLKNVFKKFGEHEVVSDLNLETKAGEFLVLVGPSGCGKTTTLRMIAGLEEITSGQIYIGDRLVNDILPRDRDIAMVFQNYALYPHMTVSENLAFGLKLRRISRKEITKRITEASEILGLKHLLERKPKQLSGGQRQRVALGRAIVRQPSVFLMDEPLSNLDAKLRVQTRGQLKKLHDRLKTTIIYVTHDQVEAMTLGERIAVMNDGVLQQLEEPLKIYQNPDNIFVAGFIGSPAMNFIEGMVVEEKGTFYFAAESFKVRMPSGLVAELVAVTGKPSILGARPEDLSDKDNARCFLESDRIMTVVDFCEILGSENFGHLKCGQTALIAKLPPQMILASGEKLEIYLNLDKIHLFDAETKKAII
jgi:multiple sugar transport system ATP-binding protein